MAQFGENFLEFQDTPNFKRIPITCVGDQWYITIGKNSVTQVQDCKSVHTWIVKQGHIHYFSTPVAYFEGKLYSVIDETVLLRWSVEDKNLENAEHFQLPEEVFSVIHLPGAEPLVVFMSGKIAVINANTFCGLKLLQNIEMTKNVSLVWVNATVSATIIQVFCQTFDRKTKKSTLYYFAVNKSDETAIPLHTYHLHRENAYLKACALNPQDLSFFSLWSDGTLLCYSVKDSSDRIIPIQQDVGTDTVVDICCVDSTYIVVAKGKQKDQECLLEIWDVKHCMLKGSKRVKTPELTSLQISASDNYIFMNFAHNKLIAIPFFVDSSFFSTLNTCEPMEFHQHLWNRDLEVKQIPAEDEPMEDEPMNESINCLDQSSLDSMEALTEKLLKENPSNFKFISESDLVRFLRILIRNKRFANLDEFCKNIYNLKSLNIIFTVPFTDALLRRHLKDLNVEETFAILSILLRYLDNSINMPEDITLRPSELQIVNWMCLLLSSHIEALFLTKEKSLKKLMKDTLKVLYSKIKEYEDLRGLQNCLSLLQIKDILPEEGIAEKYSLETLDFSQLNLQ